MICNSRLALEARVAWQRSTDLLSGDPEKRADVYRTICDDIYTQRIQHPLTIQLEKTACHVSSERMIAEALTAKAFAQ